MLQHQLEAVHLAGHLGGHLGGHHGVHHGGHRGWDRLGRRLGRKELLREGRLQVWQRGCVQLNDWVNFQVGDERRRG